MNNYPLVSIMMPAYNAEDTILRAIKSLQNQTYQNWECIIVDDGSKDRTADIVQSFQDDRLKLIRLNKNQGRPYARQIALDNCQGEYLAMLDADDWYYSNKLTKQVQAFIRHPELAVVSCGMAVTNKFSEITGVRSIGTNEVKKYLKPGKIPVPHAPSMYKAEVAKKIEYDKRFKLSQDSDFLRRLLMNNQYMLLDFVGYVYEEQYSNRPLKTIKSYFYSSMGYLKFIRDFPLRSISGIATQNLKLSRMVLFTIFNKYDKAISSRSEIPNKLQIEEFERQKKNIQ